LNYGDFSIVVQR